MHNLKIENGCHNRPNKIPLKDRTCTFDQCNQQIEDEFHFMLECKKFKEIRDKALKNLMTAYPFLLECDSEVIFWFWMQCIDYEVCQTLTTFIKQVNEIRGNL